MAKQLVTVVVLAALAACLQAAAASSPLTAEQRVALHQAGYGAVAEQWPMMMAASMNAGLVSDEICQGGAVACGGPCSDVIASCVRIPAPSGDVWLNTGNTTCPRDHYCQNGACTSQAPDACAEPQPSRAYECSGPGYFPDVTSCTKYFFCTDALEAYAYDCTEYGSGLVYDQRSAQCVPSSSSSSSTCTKLSCVSSGSSSFNNRVWVYPAYPNVYALCRSATSNAEAVVLKCPDNQVMDSTAARCVDGCLEAGRYRPVDAEDDRTYVECVALYSSSSSSSSSSILNRFGLPKRRRCPGTAKFDAVSQECK